MLVLPYSFAVVVVVVAVIVAVVVAVVAAVVAAAVAAVSCRFVLSVQVAVVVFHLLLLL